MPRSTMANRRAIQFDKDLELRDFASAAVSASGNNAAIAFPATKQMSFKAVINVAVHTGYVASTAQWALAIEVSADNATFRQVGNSVVPTGTVNQLEIALEGAAVEDVVPNAAYVRVVHTKTGTPGNLTYGAFLTTCC